IFVISARYFVWIPWLGKGWSMAGGTWEIWEDPEPIPLAELNEKEWLGTIRWLLSNGPHRTLSRVSLRRNQGRPSSGRDPALRQNHTGDAGPLLRRQPL